MTDHREMLVEAMAGAAFTDETSLPWREARQGEADLYRADMRAALGALTTGPVFEEMVRLALRAYANAMPRGEWYDNGAMAAALSAALGAEQPPADQNEHERP